MEEPRTAGFIGRAQLRQRRIRLAQYNIRGRIQRIQHEAFAAQPLQPLQQLARFLLAPGTGQRIGVG